MSRPGYSAVLETAIASYLKEFADYYTNEPQRDFLSSKYLNCSFLLSIAEKLLVRGDQFKLDDYKTKQLYGSGNNSVMDNDFLRITFGLHNDLYQLVLYKYLRINFPSTGSHDDFKLFKIKIDPFTILPFIIRIYLESTQFDNDDVFNTNRMLAIRFLDDYCHCNFLHQEVQDKITFGNFLISWNQFCDLQVSQYDPDLVADSLRKIRSEANVLYKQEKYADSLAILSQGLLINPNDHRLLSIRSAVYSQLKNNEKSAADLQKAVELCPSDVISWSRLAFSLLIQGNALDSFSAYNNAILAIHGKLLPLDLKEPDIQLFTDLMEKRLNPTFVNKLIGGFYLARQRAIFQGYPAAYLDDLRDPQVLKILKKYRRDTPPPAPVVELSTSTTTQQNRQTQRAQFSTMFTPTGGEGPVPELQQVFRNVQEQLQASNQGNAANAGAQIFSNLINFFSDGVTNSESDGSLPPQPRPAPTNSSQPAPQQPAPQPAPQQTNSQQTPDQDQDPDIDIDDVMQDQPTSTTRPAPAARDVFSNLINRTNIFQSSRSRNRDQNPNEPEQADLD